jgi:hypothetical protein
MPQRIFISDRREDAGANALGISQYLEKEFGRKNVFIDVDMRAGAKFPTVLEERLAECKVLLALIGPEWLTSRNEQGQRRIDLSDDWVRLEIAHALKRDITVIPVRVNGAMLPSRENLPEDIRGLLDHQAVSLTLPGFRHEMSGLVRDIRAIHSPRPWRRFGITTAGFVCLLAALAAVWVLTKTVSQSGKIWSASPGEWVLFGAGDTLPVGNYFKPSTSKKFGDHAVLTIRTPLPAPATPATGPLGVYGDTVTVFDCKKNVVESAENTIYNKAGENISQIKFSVALLTHQLDAPGSMISAAMRIACDESLATSLGDQVKRTKLTYLFRTQTGDGDLSYGPATRPSDSPFQYEVLLVTKLFQNHSLADLFAKKPLLNYPSTYRNYAQVVQCTDTKGRLLKTDDFDAQDNLVFIDTRGGEFDVPQEGTALSAAKSHTCGAAATVDVDGYYQGMSYITFKKTGLQSELSFSITIKQNGADLKVTYLTGGGGQGEGVGTRVGADVNSMTLQGTTPGCPGSYEASFKFAEDSLTWSFKGEDCSESPGGARDRKKAKDVSKDDVGAFCWAHRETARAKRRRERWDDRSLPVQHR